MCSYGCRYTLSLTCEITLASRFRQTMSQKNMKKRYVPTLKTTLKTQAARTIRRTFAAIQSGRVPGKSGRPSTKPGSIEKSCLED